MLWRINFVKMLDLIRKNKVIAVFVSFLIIGLAVYANSFGNHFFWDDDDVIVKNAYVQNFNVGKMFSESMISGSGQTSNYYRPIHLLSFSIDHFFWGLSYPGYALTNIILHVLVCWLIFILLYLLLSLRRVLPYNNKKVFWLAFLPALIFLVHPLNTESVTYISGRAEILATFFMILGLLFYRRAVLADIVKKKIVNYVAVIVFFILALLSKETAVVFPLLAVLIDFIFLSAKTGWKRVLEVLKNSSILLVLTAVYIILHFTVFNFSNISGVPIGCIGDYCSYGIFQRAFTFLLVVLNYFSILFVPLHQHMERDVAEFGSIYSWRMVLAILAVLAFLAAAVLTWRKDRKIFFGFFWFFILLAPTSGIAVKMLYPTYEHFLYPAMIGFWLVFLGLVFMAFERVKSVKTAYWLKRIFYVMIIAYLVFLSALTINRNRDWHDPITFYEKNLKYSPNSFIEHNNLGMAYSEAGRFEESISEYKKALAIRDIYPQVHYNLGNSLIAVKKYSEAEKEYRRAIEIAPGFVLPRQNLYQLYLHQGEKDKAEELFREISK
jgi:hypothetical protein